MAEDATYLNQILSKEFHADEVGTIIPPHRVDSLPSAKRIENHVHHCASGSIVILL